MPREKKKRGRREEKKRKREEQDEHGPLEKRHRAEAIEEDYVPVAADNDTSDDQREYGIARSSRELPYYGLLDEQEQAYFKRADAMLELNQFENAEERQLFVNSVYREADGKELKIANSQSCSRFLERLIQVSDHDQLKTLFRKFSSNFLNLVQHRFASHCCEALLLRSAPVVTQEWLSPVEKSTLAAEDGQEGLSMERAFLDIIKELDGNLGYLMTDPFASHVLRVLLVILSGRPLASTSTTSILQSKKKEKVEVSNFISDTKGELEPKRAVPNSFSIALDSMISGIIAGLDTAYLRAIATQPIGNPVLQLLLEIDFVRHKSQRGPKDSILSRLIPDDPLLPETESAKFLTGLMYDSVGSHLLESIVQNAPGKTFKHLYRNLYKDKLVDLVKNETAGFVVAKMLQRLSKEELSDAVEKICPLMPLLIEREKTSMIKTLIERCQVRNIAPDQIAAAIKIGYVKEESSVLFRMLDLSALNSGEIDKSRKSQIDGQNTRALHGSLLGQVMLQTPGPLCDLILSDLSKLDTKTLVLMAKSRTATHVVQKAMQVPGQSKVFNRWIVQQLLGHITELATDSVGSYVIDGLWAATQDVFFLRERIAEELTQNEQLLRESFSGRSVWRNWMMDLYKRRRFEWIARAKGTSSEVSPIENSKQRPKSALDLAREKFSAKKANKGKTSRASGTNSTPVLRAVKAG